jgi:CDP-paratose 2-epimerase
VGTVVVTGSAGLIGSEAVRTFAERGFSVVGLDNDMRRRFFGDEASTAWNRRRLEAEVPGYRHVDADVRDAAAVDAIFAERGTDVAAVVHTAAQPSHDWAAREPFTDFTVNANGTLVLLEATRRHCPEAVFLFTSTNKVYGDTPNALPLVERETRYEIDPGHPFAAHGIDESMSIDASKHSLFGASKLAADVLVQEYGRYFGIKTACFRAGCLTGPAHAGTELHGFLAYLVKCALTGTPYTVHGYKGKQVRDNIDSRDFVAMLWHAFRAPRVGEVYNAGGSRHANCSILEAVELVERITGQRTELRFAQANRSGDHIWWISDVRKFRAHYPGWDFAYGLEAILTEIAEGLDARLRRAAGRPA